jgi:hypothetical protein
MLRESPTPPARPGVATAAVIIAVGVWFALLRAAARIDPAAVQLLLAVTAATVIYMTLGNSPRRPGQLSAYSVFNPNCAPLLGQLRAEQFDQEVRHRPTYVSAPGPVIFCHCQSQAPWCSACDGHCRVKSVSFSFSFQLVIRC